MNPSLRLISLVFATVFFQYLACADDVITIAKPEDVQTFDAAVSKKLGKMPENKQNNAISQAVKPDAPEVAPNPVSTERPAPTTSIREDLVKKLVRELQKQNLESFRELLTPASRASLGSQESMNHLNEIIADQKDFKLVDEAVAHSVSGTRPDGTVRPILQLFTGAIQATDSSGQQVKMLKLKMLCGLKTQEGSGGPSETETCLIQELSSE